jgi:RNA polymerase sigma factor (sigma-70 family)
MRTVELGHENADVLAIIKSGNRSYLRELYQKHRREFDVWAAKHYKIDSEMAGEVYQQAFITLYYNIQDGKLNDLKSTVKTYLFGIAKNIMRDQFKLAKRFTDPIEENQALEDVDNSVVEKFERAELKELVRKMLNTIGEPCKTVLELYYFQQYSMDSIATELNYKSEQIAAKRKFICLKQLNKMISVYRIDI